MKKFNKKIMKQMLIALSIITILVAIGFTLGPAVALLVMISYVITHLAFIKFSDTKAYLHSDNAIKTSKKSPDTYLCPFCNKVLYYEEIVQQKCSGCKESIKWSDRI